MNSMISLEAKFMSRKIHSTTRPVTVRFSAADYQILVQDAEGNNVSVAEMLRKAWADHKEKNSFQASFELMERRISKKTFEIVCAIANLSDQQRISAYKEFQENLRGDFTE
jgi:hypothetical protein